MEVRPEDLTAQTDRKEDSRQLRRRLTGAGVALLVAFFAVVSATYAWYIYNTGRHTTKVRMAAGAGANLQISNSYDGTYGSAAILDSFEGLTPVSTNRISGGFQKVTKFIDGTDSQPDLVAGLFGRSREADQDYYHTSLFLRTNGSATDIYLSNIGFEDSNERSPISSAIRVGLVVHKAGRDQGITGEYIFAISDKKNPKKQYNTATGREGYVLDSTKKDGTTVPFRPYNSDAYCIYDVDTGMVTLKPESLRLCTVEGTADGKAGTAVEVEIYVWLEGCDEDCTANLCNTTLKNLAVSFAGLGQ